jgi:hypothetical protein
VKNNQRKREGKSLEQRVKPLKTSRKENTHSDKYKKIIDIILSRLKHATNNDGTPLMKQLSSIVHEMEILLELGIIRNDCIE